MNRREAVGHGFGYFRQDEKPALSKVEWVTAIQAWHRPLEKKQEKKNVFVYV